jgi:serine/threonine protein phosphatase PrpC
MGIIHAGATDIGRKRKTNQDSIYLGPEFQLYAVADGMGGHNGGDIASQMATTLIPAFLQKYPDMEPRERLTACIRHVNQQIHHRSEEQPELKGMGTTLTAILFQGQQLMLGNVGDSRVYMVHGGLLYQLSRDHSFVQEKLTMGVYTREEAALDKQKNVLVRSVGFDADVAVDVFTYRVCKNDIFLLCSDGLHGKVSDHDILYILQKNIPDPARATRKDLDNAVKELIHQANENGGQDNISVIITVAQE